MHHINRLMPRQAKKDAIDYFVNFFMYLSPLFELPQAYDIYSRRNSHTVSLTTWVLFFVASTAWLIYAVRNKLRTLIIIQTIYLIVEAIVVIGILIYP